MEAYIRFIRYKRTVVIITERDSKGLFFGGEKEREEKNDVVRDGWRG